jgi:hypothetical protein
MIFQVFSPEEKLFEGLVPEYIDYGVAILQYADELSSVFKNLFSSRPIIVINHPSWFGPNHD